jgi:proteasome assembly chaperone 3
MALPSFASSSLPASHLTPTTLLGGGSGDRETVGQLYAAQLASYITLINPAETRTLVLGLGLQQVDIAREAFFDILELVQRVLLRGLAG